jgi:hypothetical protein
MRSVLCLALAVACSPASTNYPVGIGPGGPGGGDDDSGSPDAGSGSGSGSGSGPISGRVCLLTDVRDFTSCATTGADGITVALPGVTAVTTIADGTFVIQRPTGSDLVWSLTGTLIMPSTIGFGASATIPAISTDAFNTLAANNSVVVDPDQGSILGEIFADTGSDDVPADLATTTSNPVGEYTTFYSSATDKDDWPGVATDTLGTFWIAGMTPGSAAMTFTADGGFPETGPTLAVGSGSVTFVTFGL